MARYEFSEGTSNKFWEINLSGKSFTTTYGKIGTPGQTTMKEFASPAEAKKEHDKLVAEKTKKGYELAGGAGDDGDDDEADEAPPPKKVAAPAPKAAAPAPKAAAPAPKAAAPAAKPAAAKPAAKATAPRYFEFSEGTSNKFWEIV